MQGYLQDHTLKKTIANPQLKLYIYWNAAKYRYWNKNAHAVAVKAHKLN